MEVNGRPSKTRKLSHTFENKVGENDNKQNPSSMVALSMEQNLRSRHSSDGDVAVSTTETYHTREELENDKDESVVLPIVLDDLLTSQSLSKSQLKKLRRREAWEASREERKKKRKEKRKERVNRKRERRQREAENGELNGDNANNVDDLRRTARTQRPIQLPVTFVIDCGFDDKMADNERISLGSQVTRAYSDNSHAPYQAHLVVSSWGGLLKERFDTVLQGAHKNWKGINITEEDFVAAAEKASQVMIRPRGGRMEGAFRHYANSRTMKDEENNSGKQGDGDGEREGSDVTGHELQQNPASTESRDLQEQNKTQPKDRMHRPPLTTPTLIEDTVATPLPLPTPLPEAETIYLTSDSPHTLTSLRPFSTYIVGGLVDKNRHKGICYRTAQDRNVQTAKLPIGEFLDMQTRSVLTTNHVVEIMIRWLECGDWGEAFVKVLPKRKGAILRKEKVENKKLEEETEEKDVVVMIGDDEEEREESITTMTATDAASNDEHDDDERDNKPDSLDDYAGDGDNVVGGID